MKFVIPALLVGAAIMEVAGDAIIRAGLRGRGIQAIIIGCVVLGGYGLLVNTVPWDFSKLLGVYVAIFALISILAGKFVFHEEVPPATWLGLVLIVAGGLVIQIGARKAR